MKKSFVLFTDFYGSIKDLPAIEKAALLDAIFQYALDHLEIKLSVETKMAFSFIKRELDRNEEKWKDIKIKRQEAGHIGGLKRAKNLANQANATFAKQIKQEQANQAVNVNVNLEDNSSYKKEKQKEEGRPEFFTNEQAEKLFKLAEKASNEFQGGIHV